MLFLVLLTEGTDHSWGSTTEASSPCPHSTRPPPPGGLHLSSLPLAVTPERQTSDWPRYISDHIPLGKAWERVALIRALGRVPQCHFPAPACP